MANHCKLLFRCQGISQLREFQPMYYSFHVTKSNPWHWKFLFMAISTLNCSFETMIFPLKLCGLLCPYAIKTKRWTLDILHSPMFHGFSWCAKQKLGSEQLKPFLTLKIIWDKFHTLNFLLNENNMIKLIYQTKKQILFRGTILMFLIYLNV